MAKRLALLGLVLLLGLGSWALLRMGRKTGTRSEVGSEAPVTPRPSETELDAAAPAQLERARSPIALPAAEEPQQQQRQDEPAEPERLWYGRVVDGETRRSRRRNRGCDWSPTRR